MQKEQKKLLEQLRVFLENNEISSAAKLLEQQRSSDISEVVTVLDKNQQQTVFNSLDKTTAAEVLEKVDEATRSELFELLKESQIKEIFSELDADDAADLMAELPETISKKVISSLPAAEAIKIRKLMRYSEDSAGGIMDTVVISVSEHATVAEAADKIRAAEIDEDFFSVYVVDDTGCFLGDVRIRFLLTSPENTKIKTLIEPNAIYVVSSDDQEKVRNVFSQNDLIVVPVLDDEHKLIGRITADRIIEVAEQEAAEDLYTMAGTDPDELERFSALHAARIRMTWLLPCLIGTGLTAVVLMFFEHSNPILYISAVAFVPMIAAISGNAGLQTSTIVVSGLASGHLAALKFKQVFSREVRIALAVAVCCGVVGGGICAVLMHFKAASGVIEPVRIIFAFGTAMFSAIMVATTLGLSLPFLFRRAGIDPAISSGPLVTTANDSISVSIYMVMVIMLAC